MNPYFAYVRPYISYDRPYIAYDMPYFDYRRPYFGYVEGGIVRLGLNNFWQPAREAL